MRKSKGITLIALVITIVVLIILAGVAISLSIGENGIFSKAKYASEEYANEQAREETEIAKYSNEIDNHVNGSRDTVTIPKEEYEILTNRFNPNKTLQITDFTDTKTEQTYTIPYTGWLFITVTRNASSFTISYYRNDMHILCFNGAGNNYARDSVYVPVNKGDIIKKTQNNTGFASVVNLYYYEVEENS